MPPGQPAVGRRLILPSLDAVAITLALLTAVLFGTGDFFGGLAGKRMSVLRVVAASHAVGLIGITAASLVLADQFRSRDLALGALSGMVGVVGLLLLYRGLARGPMGVVAPLTAITSAAVPGLWGTVVDGDRLSTTAWIGVAMALVAIALTSIDGDTGDAPVTARVIIEALGAGTGFGVMFIIFAETDPLSAPWPIVGARLLTAIGLGFWFLVRRRPIFPRDAISLRLVIALGFFDTGSNAVFLYAADHGSLTVVAVLSSLYPVATVVLARVVLSERLSRVQEVGFVAAMVATGLIAAG